ncbi:diguanylate cyclase/phosphodiesterase with PAS/PAC sensor(s) [Gloeocapsa sp. PCC 7428]|nr:diguanylate cyclase/phosphodiesterase with PAS/PAC sensor(s) [Gloeocapsa sp. PCC 7428]
MIYILLILSIIPVVVVSCAAIVLTCGAIALKTILESTYSQSLQTYFPLIIFGCISVAVITLGKAIVWLLNRWQFDKRFFLASGTLVKSFAGMHDMKMAMLPMLVGSVTFCISTFWLKLHFAKKTAFWWQVGVAIAILAVSAGIHYAYPTAQLAIEVADLTTIVVLLLVVQQALSSRRLYTEVALAESQRRLATLIDSLPGIAFACSNDPNWSMTYVSEGCLELTGYCSEELIGITGLYNAITHPKDLPRVLQSITKAVEAQQPYVIEYRINTKSGEQKWLWEKGSGVFDSHGQVLGLEGFITDISELKRSEAALKESEQRYRELFESHPCPMWVYDIETLAFLAVNNAAIAHYGYERDEFLSMTIKDIRPSEDVASLLQQLKHLKSELSPHGIWRHRKKDGTIIKVEVSCHSLTFLGKRAAVVSAHDVTKRIQTEEALRQAEAKYRSIFENASEGIFQTTPTGQYLSANPALARIYGYDSPEELVATVTNIEKQLYVDPHRRAECIRLMQQHNCVSGFESQVYRKDGSTIWISENARIVRNIHGDIVCYEGTVEDITTRKQTEAAQARFTAILEATTDFVGIADSQGKPLYLNQAGYKILGLDPQQDISRLNIFDCHPDWANQIFLDTVVPTLLSRGVWNGEMALLNRQKEEIPVSQVIVAKSSAAGELDFVATIARDISERKRLEAQLSYLANHDSLTGLFNRRYFQAQLEHYLELALERDRESGALVLIDIDDFKDINDTLGHKAGDDLLKNLATLLQEQIEEKDILARLGGDEFAILVPQISLHDVDLIKQKIVGALKNHVVIANGQPVRITASIGATVFPDHGIVADELFAHADLAMYKSKKLGSNCFSLYTPDPHWQVQIQSRNFWKNQIREALEQNLFVLYCQPILDLQQNTFSCYEILIRMLGKDKEIISPNTFLPIAEECGLISHIDRWVVCQAIHLIANQAKVGNNLRLEVNISGKSLSDSELLPMIQQELATTGINPASLVLEITETAAIADFSQARKFINTLKQIGCQFAIDDFGMGYSSFAQLKHLPVDYLKIDGSFIKNLAKDVLDRHLVKAIVEVARGLSIATIAEFVALPETLQLLHELGVNYAQGYYIGEPMPVAELSNQWGSIANDEARRSHWHLSTQIVKQAYTLTSS